MNKRILCTALAAGFLFSASALSYRGFLDLQVGVGTGDATTFASPEYFVGYTEISPNVGFGISTTHGVQVLPCLYAGVGVGGYALFATADGYNRDGYHYLSYDGGDTQFIGMSLPVYLDIRYDLNIRKKVTPYVDVKIGYSAAVNVKSSDDDIWMVETDPLYFTGSSYHYSSGSKSGLTCKPSSGMYFQPSVGLRFRTGRHGGFNLGVSYNTSVAFDIGYIRTGLSRWDPITGESLPLPEADVKKKLGKFKTGLLMLNLGFDF